MRAKERIITEEEKLKEMLTDSVNLRISNVVAVALYNIAKENKMTMSEVARLCIETRLMDVGKLLKEVKKLKMGLND
jgi:hypothetical protein